MTGPEFRRFRLALGLTQRQMGERLGGKTPRQIQNYEAGKTPVPPLVAQALARLKAA